MDPVDRLNVINRDEVKGEIVQNSLKPVTTASCNHDAHTCPLRAKISITEPKMHDCV